jgi:hypothetical protein
MLKALFAIIIAASISLTGAPQAVAQADGSDVAKVAAGIALAAAIGTAIKKSKDRDAGRDAAEVARFAAEKNQPDRLRGDAPRNWGHDPRRPTYGNAGRRHDADRGRGRPGGGAHESHRLLPAQCLVEHQTPRGNVALMGARCLNRNYRHGTLLPQACLRQVGTSHGLRHGHDPLCLRDAGFRIADRH